MSHLLAGLAWLALGIALVLARERVFQPAVAAHEHFWGRLGVRILRVPATIYDEGLADARAANPYHYMRSGQSRVTLSQRRWVRWSFHAHPASGQHRTTRSISTSDPRARLVTPTVVRAGKRPGLK